MVKKSDQLKINKLAGSLTGCILLVLGMALILAWWQDVVILFRAVLGIALALAGLVMLYFLSQQ